MRLKCPRCSAQYEIDGALIPEKGRDVQCSNCGTTWFQAAPPSTTVSPEAMSILREEAERELRQRGQTLQTQPDFGASLDEAEGPDASPGTVTTKVTTIPPGRGGRTITTTTTMPEGRPRTKSDLLPDIEEVSSGPERGTARTANFQIGFALSLGITAVLLAVYVYADEIAEAVPTLRPLLFGYVGIANDLRGALSDLLGFGAAVAGDT